METVKNNWPYLAVGAAAVGLATYLYLSNEYEAARVKEAKKEAKLRKKATEREAKAAAQKAEQERKEQELKELQKWPDCHNLLNMGDAHDKQLKSFDEWLKNKLAPHITHRGNFKVDKDHALDESDFVKIYHLIECYTNAKLFEKIKQGEEKRKPLFKAAMVDGVSAKVAEYLNNVSQ